MESAPQLMATPTEPPPSPGQPPAPPSVSGGDLLPPHLPPTAAVTQAQGSGTCPEWEPGLLTCVLFLVGDIGPFRPQTRLLPHPQALQALGPSSCELSLSTNSRFSAWFPRPQAPGAHTV